MNILDALPLFDIDVTEILLLNILHYNLINKTSNTGIMQFNMTIKDIELQERLLKNVDDLTI